MKKTYKALFGKLQDTGLIARCVSYAHWTLPRLMADVSVTQGKSRALVERDYQEVGALLVNGLAAKLAKLLFPANIPYFRIDPSEELMAEAEATGTKAELEGRLAELELKASQRIFRNASYSQLIQALAHLIVTGNVLMYRDERNGKLCTYGMQSYGIRRDGRGVVQDCVLREYTTPGALAPSVLEVLRASGSNRYADEEMRIELYTRIKLAYRGENPVYEVSQEIEGIPVGVPGEYPVHACPWMFPVWSLVLGESYGRGLVEDFAGGFAKLSNLSESAALYGIEMMRVLHIVGAGAGTDIDDLANAESGEYIQGDPASIHAHEAGDAAKLQAIKAEIADVVGNLAKAFMFVGQARDSERTTALELQLQAQEAEYALGGAYSSLADGVQVPLAAILLREEDASVLAGMLTGDLRPQIVAGIPALGRSSDVQNLLVAAQEAIAVVPNLAQIDQRLDPHKVIDLIMSGRSVAYAKLHKSEEQLAEEAAAQQQAAQGMQQVQEATAGLEQLSALTGAGVENA